MDLEMRNISGPGSPQLVKLLKINLISDILAQIFSFMNLF